MTEKTIIAPHIAVQPGVRGGRPFIDGKGVAVATIATWHEEHGMPLTEIINQFGLTSAEIHAALAFYSEHKTEIDARKVEDEVFAARMRPASPSPHP